MNYTENYHLPQWKKEDRVMMEDFNRMCQDMETGLLANRGAAKEDGTALESRTFQQLCRLAYNHYRVALAVEPLPVQSGLFFQDVTLSGEIVDGMDNFDGAQCLNHSDGCTADALSRTIQVSSPFNNSSGKSLVFTFTAPCNGILKTLGTEGTIQANGLTALPYDLKVENLTTGQTYTKSGNSIYFQTGTNGAVTRNLVLNINFHQSHKYRVTATGKKSTAVVSLQASSNSEAVIETRTTGSTGTADYTFQGTGENLGAVAVVTFEARSGVLPVFTWNGTETIPLLWTRELDNGNGTAVREAVFARRGQTQDGDTVQLQFTCPKNQEVKFHNWGILLI